MRLINFIVYIFIVSVFSNCDKQLPKNTFSVISKKIIDKEVANSELKLVPEKGQWFFEDKPYNGFALKYHSNGELAEKIGFYNGKREGKAHKYHTNGKLKKEMFYVQNRLHGKAYNYFDNGNLVEESTYQFGKRNGVQKIWYKNGQLAKLRNLKDGKEEGMQQAWLENGKIYVNYEAKNGRIFGMNRANLCYQLKQEEIEYVDKK